MVIFFAVAGVLVGDDPFDDKREGVKLGESTLKRFLLLLPTLSCKLSLSLQMWI